MSIQKDKKSGKEFKLTSATSISASAASGGTINGQVARFVGVDKIPYRLKQGDQSFYFDITKVETGSIVRTDDGVVYIPYKKKNFQDMMIGDTSDAKSRFSDTAYQQISAAFASKISNVDDNLLFTQIVEEFYTSSLGPSGSFVGAVTASYELRTSNGVTQSYSGIDNGAGVDFLIENNSTFSTHTNFQVGIPLSTVTQSIFLTSSLINIHHRGSNTASFTSTNNTFSSPVSGTIIGTGIVTNINNSNDDQGIYASYALKIKMAGDGDSGSLYSFASSREIIVYNGAHASFGVSSGSFQYHPTSTTAATGSGTFKTLYYHTGTAGPSGSYTGSLSTSNPLSSPLHGDAALKTTASYGYYNTPGTTDVYLVSSSSIFNLTPRFVTKSIL